MRGCTPLNWLANGRQLAGYLDQGLTGRGLSFHFEAGSCLGAYSTGGWPCLYAGLGSFHLLRWTEVGGQGGLGLAGTSSCLTGSCTGLGLACLTWTSFLGVHGASLARALACLTGSCMQDSTESRPTVAPGRIAEGWQVVWYASKEALFRASSCGISPPESLDLARQSGGRGLGPASRATHEALFAPLPQRLRSRS